MKIEKLTKQQSEMMPIYVEKWLDYGLNTEPADRPKAEAAIRLMYEMADLQSPVIVWCDSPLSMILSKTVRASVGDSVRASVGDSVMASVGDSVRASVRDSVRASVRDSVGASVWGSVRASVGASVGDSVRDSVGDSVWDSVYGQHEAGWLSFYDFFRHELALTSETEKLSGILDLAMSCGWILPHENICFASERHYVCHVDEAGLIHSEVGPAVAYKDGFEIHAWHGVRVPANWIENPETVNPDEILSSENVEQRSAGLAIVGVNRMLDSLNHRILDSDPNPEYGGLYEVHIPGLPEPGRYLKAFCPRNETIFEGVPNDINTVLEAQAWRVGIPASEFTYPERRT